MQNPAISGLFVAVPAGKLSLSVIVAGQRLGVEQTRSRVTIASNSSVVLKANETVPGVTFSGWSQDAVAPDEQPSRW